MIEVSTVLFTLLTEGFIALLIVLSVLAYILLKRKNGDKVAARKLVTQIKQQSKVRLGNTGSFLCEKYRFEGNELEKAVKEIDQAEKKFIQKMLKVYLQRDADGLASMDASVAELIEAYKELSPVMPDAEELAKMAADNPEQLEELEKLRENNEKLAKEIAVTKETMANMVAEFGNMFGGGVESKLEEEEVMGKVIVHGDDVISENEEISESTTEQDVEKLQDDSIESVVPIDTAENEGQSIDDLTYDEGLMQGSVTDRSDDEDSDTDVKKSKEKVKTSEVFDTDIDDLIDGIDLSDDSL